MSTVALSALLALSAATSGVLAQSASSSAFVPLASKHFAYPSGIPYQADPDDGVRGTQQGYNLCNSTTEGTNSLCQTAFVNHLDDWCVWAPPKPDSTIGDTEGEEVAWCTKKGRGTRIIPAGAITGVQFMKTPGYLQIVGFIDQTKINLQSDDGGGELDPHGADLRGNPLGGLVYSNGFASNNGNNNTFQQVIEWHNFMGSNSFCFKVCDPAGSNAAELCQHVFDRIGVSYNCPNAAQNGTFEYCEGDNQDPPGIYTSNGQVVTYTQPPESLGPISTMPYDPKIPASSNCVPLQSALCSRTCRLLRVRRPLLADRLRPRAPALARLPPADRLLAPALRRLPARLVPQVPTAPVRAAYPSRRRLRVSSRPLRSLRNAVEASRPRSITKGVAGL